MTVNRVGSMFTWFFTDRPVTDFASAAHGQAEVGFILETACQALS